MKRPTSPVNVAARERASTLLAGSAPAGDVRVTVLGILLRRPDAFVTYMELRAESQPLAAEAVDVALQWLVLRGMAEQNDLPPWGLAYRALPDTASRARGQADAPQERGRTIAASQTGS